MKFFLITIVAIIISLPAMAQRRITPVGTPAAPTSFRAKADSLRRVGVVEQIDAQGNTILVDTITGREYVDSSAIVPPPKMIYPTLTGLQLGVNIWDAAMRIFGQNYGLGGVWAALSIHNRYFPYFEAGIGMSSLSPSDANFTFKVPMSPYFKIGANYNFLYNSEKAYQLYAGVRYGFTPFRYSIENVTVTDGYWDTTSTYSLPRKSATAGYLEILIGINVKIAGNISVGWAVGMHTMLHESKYPYGKPVYIPGYGTRSTELIGALNVTYTLPLNKKASSKVDKEESSTELQE